MKYTSCLAAIAAVTLFGCATPPKVAFQSSEKQSLHKIAIAQSEGEEKYMMYPGQLPGGQVLYAFGAIGGAILGGIENNRIESATRLFTDAVSPFKPEVNSTFISQMQTVLMAKGYDVTVIPALSKKAGGKDYDVTNVQGNFDAILIGQIGSGYAADTGHFCPRVSANISLVSKTDGHILFAHNYLYSVSNWQDAIQVIPDVNFFFGSPEEVYSHGELAAKALKTGATLLAEKVSMEF